MEVVRFGLRLRALRRRRHWRQVDLAQRAGISRATVSRLELGHADEVTLRSIDAAVRALSARLELNLTWNGEGLDRLIDAGHAALVDRVATILQSLGWQVAIEVSFNVRGERGSIDVFAFHPGSGVVLVVEVKSVVPDVQATLHVLDRKTRLAMEIAMDRGWHARAAFRLLVVGESRTARRRVDQHQATFDAVFNAGTVAVKRWLRSPTADRAFAGLWFLSDDRHTNARHRVPRSSARPRA
jgi:transcriptional regulator with XRE-family HTH domain